jgi:hypothetical protein
MDCTAAPSQDSSSPAVDRQGFSRIPAAPLETEKAMNQTLRMNSRKPWLSQQSQALEVNPLLICPLNVRMTSYMAAKASGVLKSSLRLSDIFCQFKSQFF